MYQTNTTNDRRRRRRAWIAFGVGALVALCLLGWAAVTESHRAEMLRDLRQRGHQVRAAEVHIFDRTRGPARVTYRFLPLERKEFEVPKFDATSQPNDPDAPMKLAKQIDAAEHVMEQHPWVWGGHRISGSLRESIGLRDDRVVTYLPNNPNVNVIGKLSDERISAEWRSNPVFLFVAIWLGLSAVALFAQLYKGCKTAPGDDAAT